MALYSIFRVFLFAVYCHAATNRTQKFLFQYETYNKPNTNNLPSAIAGLIPLLPPGALVEAVEVITYVIPADVKLEAIHPRGLRVSIPDDGYKGFGFRGNVNQKLDDEEIETWEGEKRNNRWVLTDRLLKLKLGDTVYYTVYVMKKNIKYKREPEKWTVTEFVNEDSSLANVPSTVTGSELNTQSLVNIPSISTVLSCTKSRTEVIGKVFVCQGDLVFSEEFGNNNIHELLYWHPEIKFPLEPDYPFNVYMEESTLRLQNGQLIISPLLLEAKYHENIVHEALDLTEGCTGLSGTLECAQAASGAQILPPVVTGKITTRRKFNFKYGRVEVRAKLPRGDWLLPEITLEPRDKAYGQLRFESGLMRVAFAKGNDAFAKKLYGGLVLYDKEPYRSQFMKEKTGSDNWNKDYHNYTMIWKPDGIEWFVDGKRYGAVYPGFGFYYQLRQKGAKYVKKWRGKTPMAPVDEMFYVSLGLRVGGINDFLDRPGKPWKNTSSKARSSFWKARDTWLPTWTDADMKIDYVRIYAL